MESESACSARFSNSCDKKECWNGGKRASQLLIDFEATELFLSMSFIYIYIYTTISHRK